MNILLRNFSPLLIAVIFLLPLPALSKSNSIETSKVSAKLATNFENEDEFESYETKDASSEIYDPLEKYNRKIYVFNDAFDRYFLEYVAQFYRVGVPRSARMSIRNFVTNITLPFSAINSLLQGKVDNSLATFSSFLINSTIGIGGIFDVAGNKNIRYRSEDLGQTLGHYGLNSGAYLVIPFLGPSSTRDLSGWSAEKVISPLGINYFKIAEESNLTNGTFRFSLTLASGIDTRESLLDIIDDVRKDSFDPYATIRSAYLQKRLFDVKN
jgi:phospholipid-binding lipoprotein MlaA